MKKLIASFCALLCATCCLFAIDAGGTATGTWSARADSPTEFTLSPSVAVTGWIRQPLGQTGSFVTEGSLRHSRGVTVIDVSLLKASLFAGPLKLDAGRFTVSDGTGIIYAMAADGMYTTFTGQYVTAGMYGAYTGLLNSYSCEINGLAGTRTVASNLYDIAATPQFIVGMMHVALPNIVLGQSVASDVLAMYSVDSTESARVYGTLSVWGPVVPLVYYSLSGAVSYLPGISDGASKSGVMAKGSLSWYPEFLSSSVTGSVLYGSKDFVTFTAGGPGSDGSLSWDSVIDAQVVVSMKPSSIVLVGLTLDVIARTGDQLELHSYQWKCNGTVQVASDVSLSASMGEVVPLQSSVSSRFTGSVSATLAF